MSIPDIGATAASVCPGLADRAALMGVTVTGLPIFVAHGLPEDAATLFTLDVCLPVTADSGAGAVTLSSVDAACAVYEGPISGLFVDGYGPLLAAIADAGLNLTGESREVYHRWDGPDAPTNRIEIQFALA